jgi:hypothetical protein
MKNYPGENVKTGGKRNRKIKDDAEELLHDTVDYIEIRSGDG